MENTDPELETKAGSCWQDPAQPRGSYLVLLGQPWPGESPPAVGQLLTSQGSLAVIRGKTVLLGELVSHEEPCSVPRGNQSPKSNTQPCAMGVFRHHSPWVVRGSVR